MKKSIVLGFAVLAACADDSDAPHQPRPDTGFPLAGSGPIVPYEDAGTEPEICASVEAVTKPVIPQVVLVVDGSTSMSEFFGNGLSRWDTLRETLVGDKGIVPQLTRNVKFGLVQYAGGGDTCLTLRNTPPSQNNVEQLRNAYAMDPIAGGTPTDRALEYVFANLPENPEGPTFVVLATDGQPNTSCNGTGKPTNPEVEAKVVALAQGKPLTLISLAGADQALMSHMEAVAAVTESKTAPYVPATKQALVDAFQSIVGSNTCLLELSGSVDVRDQYRGTVTLNGHELTTKFYSIDGNKLSLKDAACDEYLSKASTVKAEFPCGVLVPE